jgi:hypothetical protein
MTLFETAQLEIERFRSISFIPSLLNPTNEFQHQVILHTFEHCHYPA